MDEPKRMNDRGQTERRRCATTRPPQAATLTDVVARGLKDKEKKHTERVSRVRTGLSCFRFGQALRPPPNMTDEGVDFLGKSVKRLTQKQSHFVPDNHQCEKKKYAPGSPHHRLLSWVFFRSKYPVHQNSNNA